MPALLLALVLLSTDALAFDMDMASKEVNAWFGARSVDELRVGEVGVVNALAYCREGDQLRLYATLEAPDAADNSYAARVRLAPGRKVEMSNAAGGATLPRLPSGYKQNCSDLGPSFGLYLDVISIDGHRKLSSLLDSLGYPQ